LLSKTSQPQIQSSSLVYLGNILVSDDQRIIDLALNSNLLANIQNLLLSKNQEIVMRSLWVLSNIAANGDKYSFQVADSDAID